VVLANPPYVRQELLTAYKEHWQASFHAYDGTADLFVYFFERSLQQLKPGGRLGFMRLEQVAARWLRREAAPRCSPSSAPSTPWWTLGTRRSFRAQMPSRVSLPCANRRPGRAGARRARNALSARRAGQGAARQLRGGGTDSPCPRRSSTARAGPGATGRAGVAGETAANGVPLGEYAAIKPYYGIKTGCNEAFLVDQATKERLCREDPRSAHVLKKYLRGQDIARWAAEWAGLWMIYAPWDFSLGSYPAIQAHLESQRDLLEARAEVRQERFPWYALSRYASDYVELFQRPKIVYQEIQFHPAYGLDRTGYFLNNKGFLLESEDPWLVAALNSPAMWWHNWRYLVHLKDEALSPPATRSYTCPSRAKRPATGRDDACVESIVDLTRTPRRQLPAVLDVLRIEYDVETPGQALGDFSNLGSDAFVLEVKKRGPRKARRSRPRGSRRCAISSRRRRRRSSRNGRVFWILSGQSPLRFTKRTASPPRIWSCSEPPSRRACRRDGDRRAPHASVTPPACHHVRYLGEPAAHHIEEQRAKT